MASAQSNCLDTYKELFKNDRFDIKIFFGYRNSDEYSLLSDKGNFLKSYLTTSICFKGLQTCDFKINPTNPSQLISGWLKGTSH